MSETHSLETLSEDAADSKLDELLDAPETDQQQQLVETEPMTPMEPSEEDGETHSIDEAPRGANGPGRFVADTSRVRMEDGRVITVGELKDGSLRHADYTRKTQELGDQRRDLEERNRRVQQLEETLTHERNFVYEALQRMSPQAPDSSLIKANPQAYMAAKHLHDQWREALGALKQQFAAAQQRAKDEHFAQLQGIYKAGAQTFLDVRPDLRDKRKFEAWRDDVMQFAPEVYGFSPRELWALAEPRWMLVLTDAVQWLKLQANKGKSLAKAAGKPPVRPGRRQDPSSNKARMRKSDLQRLQATGGRDEQSLDRLLDTFI